MLWLQQMLVLFCFDLSPASVAAAQQRPSDVIFITWMKWCLPPSQRSLRQTEGQCRAVPAWKPPSIAGSGLLVLGSVGGVRRGCRGIIRAKQRIMVVHLLHSCLKATFLDGRGLQQTQPSGPTVKHGPSTLLQSNVLVTLCDPLDCNPPGSSVHGISQARILKWVAISSSSGSS